MNKKRLIAVIVLITTLIILASLSYKKDSGPENTGTCGANGEFCPGTEGYKERMQKEQQKTNEESSEEIFNYQPGEIKSVIKKGEGAWILSVDLLTQNPKWIPGDDSTGDFFMNQNTKLRNLNVTSTTKAYICGDAVDGKQVDASEDIKITVQNITNEDYKVRYFDIAGSDVTAIYQQCLP